ncbi:MAG TPA: cytochrome P450 [Novosphingobium sp.]
MPPATMSPAVPRPPHVPESVVYDFDFYADPALIEDAHARALELAQEAPPVFWTPRNGGHWILRGHSAVFKASRDPSAFTVELVPYDEIQRQKAALQPGEPEPLMSLPNSVDPPHHAIYRAPLQRVFSPKAILALKGEMQTLAADLIEAVKPQGRCEFMATIAEVMPVTVFLKLFGLPVERQKEYRAVVKEHFSAPSFDHAGSQRRLRDVAAIMRETILERRDNPRDDIISSLWQSEFYGKPATLNDLENYCVMLFLAGLDTVMNGMGLGARHLAAHPALQAELRANPRLIPEATEELIRRYTFTIPVRFVAQDQVFEGVTMKRGEMALIFLPAADLDASEFPKPEHFDLVRENKVHIAFGTGPHRCLGSHLARIELQTLYEEMLARLPEFRLDPAEPLRYHGGNVWGPDELFLEWGR